MASPWQRTGKEPPRRLDQTIRQFTAICTYGTTGIDFRSLGYPLGDIKKTRQPTGRSKFGCHGEKALPPREPLLAFLFLQFKGATLARVMPSPCDRGSRLRSIFAATQKKAGRCDCPFIHSRWHENEGALRGANVKFLDGNGARHDCGVAEYHSALWLKQA